jgi:hypothetical protein
MGFWKNLFGRGKKDAKLNVFAVDTDGDGKVQDGTIWERPSQLTLDIDKTIQGAEDLLKSVAPDLDVKLAADIEAKRKRSAAAKKAAATRAAKKAAEAQNK